METFFTFPKLGDKNLIREWLAQTIQQNVYLGYLYGYPHKKAYRSLAPISLERIWNSERKEALFLYLHIPFCNQKCSFCNLFSTTHTKFGNPATDSFEELYIRALEKEIQGVGKMLGPHRFAQIYIGGGTPTRLSAPLFERLFDHLEKYLSIRLQEIPFCIECSPDTLTPDHLRLFKERGVSRLSVGIESFLEPELKQCGRLQQFRIQDHILEQVCLTGFEEVNFDLIYGLEGQTRVSFLQSVQKALHYPIQSLFLYPLYIRPLTPYAQRDLSRFMSSSEMGQCYEEVLSLLPTYGFQQYSMRKWKKNVPTPRDCLYECQVDPMIGLGAGARSYTKSLHYSTPWAMKSSNINQIIQHYIEQSLHENFSVTHGIYLNEDEQMRRFMILSLLYQGLSKSAFYARFEKEVVDYFKIPLEILFQENCIESFSNERIELTAKGRKYSDIVGHLFFSSAIREQIAYEISC